MIKLYENATHLVVTGPPKELDELCEAFKFRPDGYFHAVSYQRHKLTGGEEGWDGFIRPLYRINSTTAKILRGRKEDVIRHARLEDYAIDREKLLESPFAALEVEDVRPDLIAGDFQLDDNQRRCICDWLVAGIGMNKITIGGGKTATFAGAAALIKERLPDARFLYLTPSERLVKQVTKEMKKFLPHFAVGQCGGGHHEFDAKDMIVATVAMLARNFDGLSVDKWFDTFVAIFYDESHHASSKSSKKVLLAIPAFFRLGASDTAKEKDLARFNDIRGLLGPMLNDVKSAPLIASGRLAKPHLYIVDPPDWRGRFADIPYRPAVGTKAFMLLEGAWVAGVYAGPVLELDSKGKVKMRTVKTAIKDKEGEWVDSEEPVTVPGLHKVTIDGVEHEVESRWCLLERTYDRAVIQYKPRNDLIVEWARYFHRKGWPVVVVATRTTHVYILEALLQRALGEQHVRILVGEASPAERDATFAWLKATPNSVLVTPLVREGISINEIRAMIVADFVADFEVARQICGRAMRPKTKDNRAHVVWFWDRQHPTLRSGCAKVFKHLEAAEGFEFYHPCLGPDSVFPEDFRSSVHD